MPIKNFPFLDPEEFTLVCHHLDRRYRQAELGPIRRRWVLNACRALDVQSQDHMRTGADYATYIQITRPLDPDPDPAELALRLAAVSLAEGQADMDHDMMDRDAASAEEADLETLLKPGPGAESGYVTYEIHLHPTYRIPCLWFRIHGLASHEDALSIDTVFRRLVPDQFKDGLRKSAGGIGGISIDHHPLTGVPSFFVHPCLIGDAMSGWECSEGSYLTIWIGFAGGCVGLWVPKEMMGQD